MDLSVVIVNYKTRDRLRACLLSVFASQTRFRFEVRVVDNDSRDGSVEMVHEQFPRVKLLENQSNLGYAKANNQAIRKANSRYVLLLNPDVEVEPETFEKIVAYADANPGVGICGCRILKPDGTLDKASRRSFPNLANSFLYLVGGKSDYHLDLPDDQIAEVDSVVGAFMLVRREVIDKIGLLDEDFFMYGEDIDWCWRAKAAGFQVMYAPVTTVKHHKGSSSRKAPERALYEFHRAMRIFYDKHYRKDHNFLVNFLVSAGIWTRYVLKVFLNSFRKEKYVSK